MIPQQDQMKWTETMIAKIFECIALCFFSQTVVQSYEGATQSILHLHMWQDLPENG